MDAAESRAFDSIMRYIAAVSFDPAVAETVAHNVWNILVQEYGLEMSSESFVGMVQSQVSGIYRDFLKENPLRPRVSFTVPDTKAIEMLERQDLWYLGSAVTNDDLKARILQFIQKNYLENGRAIGNSPKELQAFMDVFGEQLNLEKWQVRRVIDTTVNRARVYGQINSYRLSGAKTFKIAGPMDSLTCAFCAEMVGQVFDVAPEIQMLDRLTNAGPEDLPYLSPFLKGAMALDDLKDSDAETLQAAGFALPPYHPQCRHFTVVDTFYDNPEDIPYSVE